MSRQGGRKTLIRRIEIGAAAVLGAAVVLYGVHLYRENKAVEAQLAAREAVSEGQERLPAFGSDTLEFNGKTYKRNSYVKAILCMGVDRTGSMQEATTSGFGGQSDGLFLVAQDTARNALKILMIPRDTMTEITLTDLSGNVLGKDVQHLTLAYAYGDGKEKSCEYMQEAVSDLMGGLKIDYYMAVDTDVISILNDAVGGVTVTVPTEGMEKKNPKFIYGSTITLHGKEAEQFVRYRDIEKSHSALYRMDQQTEYMEQFFAAAQQQAKTNSNLVADMFSSIEEYMITDMGRDLYLKMGMDPLESGGLSGDSFYTVPGQGVTTARYDEFYPDFDGLTNIILELFYRETS